ncbi:MAG: transposase [Halioglobus sp.]
MARLKSYCPGGIPQHVIQRGDNCCVCFAADEDRAAYASYLYNAASKWEVAIHAWVFMTNHVHLLVTPQVDDSLSKAMQHLGRLYAR